MGDTVTTVYCDRTDGLGDLQFTIQNKANAAVDDLQKCKLIGQAGDNSDTVLTLPCNVVIKDIIAGCATGKMRIESDGIPTTVQVDYSAQQASNSGRPVLKIPLGMKKRYRFVVEATLPA